MIILKLFFRLQSYDFATSGLSEKREKKSSLIKLTEKIPPVEPFLA